MRDVAHAGISRTSSPFDRASGAARIAIPLRTLSAEPILAAVRYLVIPEVFLQTH